MGEASVADRQTDIPTKKLIMRELKMRKWLKVTHGSFLTLRLIDNDLVTWIYCMPIHGHFFISIA